MKTGDIAHLLEPEYITYIYLITGTDGYMLIVQQINGNDWGDATADSFGLIAEFISI